MTIGMTGFEPATSRSQSECSTKLSYIPLGFRCMIMIPQIGGMINREPISDTNSGFSIMVTIKCLILFQNPIYELYAAFAAPETVDPVSSRLIDPDAWTWLH